MAAPKPAPRGQTLPHAYHRRRRQLPAQWHTRHLESFWPVGGNCPTTAAARTCGAKAFTSFSRHGLQKAMQHPHTSSSRQRHVRPWPDPSP
jgi:hypothetical protein